jgi:hypothetical protein
MVLLAKLGNIIRLKTEKQRLNSFELSLCFYIIFK